MKAENKYLNIIKKVVLDICGGADVKVVLFGSRARRDNNLYSDVDIGIIPGRNFDRKKLILLRERIEELNVPYKVELVDFSEVSGAFKKEALKKVLIWKGSK